MKKLEYLLSLINKPKQESCLGLSIFFLVFLYHSIGI